MAIRDASDLVEENARLSEELANLRASDGQMRHLADFSPALISYIPLPNLLGQRVQTVIILGLTNDGTNIRVLHLTKCKAGQENN